MFAINNKLEPVENMKREREGAPWTEEEIRQLIQYTAAGSHPEATAFAMKRNKGEVILQGLELGILTVERTNYNISEQAYQEIFNGFDKHDTDPGAWNYWNEVTPEPRTLDKIQYMANVFCDKVWYTRHLAMRYRIEHGLETVDPEIWARAQEAAERVRQTYGEENLGPYSDFEWGMMSGKLSALRWVMGDEWDMLDT